MELTGIEKALWNTGIIITIEEIAKEYELKHNVIKRIFEKGIKKRERINIWKRKGYVLDGYKNNNMV